MLLKTSSAVVELHKPLKKWQSTKSSWNIFAKIFESFWTIICLCKCFEFLYITISKNWEVFFCKPCTSWIIVFSSGYSNSEQVIANVSVLYFCFIPSSSHTNQLHIWPTQFKTPAAHVLFIPEFIFPTMEMRCALSRGPFFSLSSPLCCRRAACETTGNGRDNLMASQ